MLQYLHLKFKLLSKAINWLFYLSHRFSTHTSNTTLIKHLSIDHGVLDAKPTDRSQRAISEMFHTTVCKGTVNKPKKKRAIKSEEQKYVVAKQLALVCALDFAPKRLSNVLQIKPFKSSANCTKHRRHSIYWYVHLLQEVNDCYVEKPRAVEHIGMSLDCWTDDGCKKRAFIVFRVHFVFNFKISVVTVKTELFPHPHTAYLG